MRRHKSTPSQLSLFLRVSSSKKKKNLPRKSQKSLKQPFTERQQL